MVAKSCITVVRTRENDHCPEQHRICARNIFVNKRVLARLARGFSLRPRLRVHFEVYLHIEGPPGVRKPEYLEQLMGMQPEYLVQLPFSSACQDSALFWRAGEKSVT
jgi:hypothetical protein